MAQRKPHRGARRSGRLHCARAMTRGIASRERDAGAAAEHAHASRRRRGRRTARGDAGVTAPQRDASASHLFTCVRAAARAGRRSGAEAARRAARARGGRARPPWTLRRPRRVFIASRRRWSLRRVARRARYCICASSALAGAAPADMGCSCAAFAQVIATWGRARSSRLKLPHYTALTPMFMPVGTQGAPRRSAQPQALPPPALRPRSRRSRARAARQAR